MSSISTTGTLQRISLTSATAENIGGQKLAQRLHAVENPCGAIRADANRVRASLRGDSLRDPGALASYRAPTRWCCAPAGDDSSQYPVAGADTAGAIQRRRACPGLQRCVFSRSVKFAASLLHGHRQGNHGNRQACLRRMYARARTWPRLRTRQRREKQGKYEKGAPTTVTEFHRPPDNRRAGICPNETPR